MFYYRILVIRKIKIINKLNLIKKLKKIKFKKGSMKLDMK